MQTSTHNVYTDDECATKCPLNLANTVASKVVAEACLEVCQQYSVLVLPKCVCTPGAHCASTILYSGVGSVGVTIVVRVALGNLLERFGPVNVQSGLMSFGAFWPSGCSSPLPSLPSGISS